MFEEVQSKTEILWKWEMYRLLEEFDRKPTLPAPLVILETLFRLVKSGWKKCCRRKKEDCKSLRLFNYAFLYNT